MAGLIHEPEGIKEPDNARMYLEFMVNRGNATSKMIRVAQKVLNDSPHESALSIIDT